MFVKHYFVFTIWFATCHKFQSINTEAHCAWRVKRKVSLENVYQRESRWFSHKYHNLTIFSYDDKHTQFPSKTIETHSQSDFKRLLDPLTAAVRRVLRKYYSEINGAMSNFTSHCDGSMLRWTHVYRPSVLSTWAVKIFQSLTSFLLGKFHAENGKAFLWEISVLVLPPTSLQTSAICIPHFHQPPHIH